jgi:nicotinamide mononucleotide transporter
MNGYSVDLHDDEWCGSGWIERATFGLMQLDPWLILEVIAVAGNLAYTIYMMLNRRIGWLFGIVASLMGAILFHHQDVMAQVGLNLFYAAMGIYGWFSWGKKNVDELPITRRSLPVHLFFIGIGVVFTFILWKALSLFPTSQHPFADSFVTGFSLLATWMLARRILENWGYWIITDAGAIWLYWQIGLYWYSGLYAVYVVLSIVALVRWQREFVGKD